MSNFQYTLAKCPLSGGHTASDWWYVCSRHHDIDSAEDALNRVSIEKQTVHRYMIFVLSSYPPGQQFNIKTCHKKELQKR